MFHMDNQSFHFAVRYCRVRPVQIHCQLLSLRLLIACLELTNVVPIDICPRRQYPKGRVELTKMGSKGELSAHVPLSR